MHACQIKKMERVTFQFNGVELHRSDKLQYNGVEDLRLLENDGTNSENANWEKL